MPKIDIDLVEHALRHKASLEDSVIQSVLKELQEQAEAEAAARREQAGEREAKTYTFLATAPADADGFGVGFVVYHAEDLPPQQLGDRVRAAIAAFKNQPKKKKPLPAVETFGEAFEVIPGKFFKEQGVQVRTKTPAYQVPLPNNTIHDYDEQQD